MTSSLIAYKILMLLILKLRVEEIGRELYADGGVDAIENMFYPIEFRVKEEIGKDAKPYRSWWNNITQEWKY
jgi:hypothetical protein